MPHTLVAVFDNRRSAQQAVDDLRAKDFAREQVRLSEDDPSGQTGQAAGMAGTDESIGAGIGHFFRDLFGTRHSEHAQMYEGAVTRGHFVVSVTVPSETEVERAADIVERHGPVDIDEHAALWGSGAQPPAGTGSGAPAPARAGVRIYQRDAADDDELYYRDHWASTYASLGVNYDDYAPAYRYGSAMAGHDSYRGRAWDEAEPALRNEWEAKNAGSPWDAVKAAVWRGWERVTS